MLEPLTPIDRDQDRVACIESPNIVYERLRDLTDSYNNIVNILNDGKMAMPIQTENMPVHCDHGDEIATFHYCPVCKNRIRAIELLGNEFLNCSECGQLLYKQYDIYRYREILHFIDHFRMYDKDATVKKTFQCGCCYWFAHILATRFEGGVIVYNPVENHFMTRIDGNIFDISGDVTADQFGKVLIWDNFNDETEKMRIIRHCIDFVMDE